MKHIVTYKTLVIKHDTPDRTLEAEVCYRFETWHEPRPYGMGVAYEANNKFEVLDVDYLTEDMTPSEQTALNEQIRRGPYE
jgi:hypothetical protein